MSTWRLKGYVQDSDEEDDDLEILPPRLQQETLIASPERVEDIQPTVEFARHDIEDETRDEDGTRPPASPITLADVVSPTPPSQTRVQAPRERTESPDPIQASPSCPASHNGKLPLFSDSLGKAASSQATAEPDVRSQIIAPARNGLLAAYGLDEDLSSTDDNLSDPPTDFEFDTPSRTVFASPKRRLEVQVIIPQSIAPAVIQPSTAPQPETRDETAGRIFRERRPIQVHPYLLEGERYRQELRGRGIKPVARVVSPVRKAAHDNPEKDQEFEPGQNSNPADPLDIIASTPIIRRPLNAVHTFSARRPKCISTNQQPTLATGAKRRKLSHNLDQPAAGEGNKNCSRDIWTIPLSPPHSSSPLPKSTGSVLRRLARSAVASTPADLPTPSLSSSLGGDVQGEGDSDPEPVVRSVHRPTQQPRPFVTISSDSSSSDAEKSNNSEPSEIEIKRVGKRIKGVLPASWLRLNRPAQDKSKLQPRSPLNEARSPEKAGPQRGVAQKVVGKRRSTQRTFEPTGRYQELVVISNESDDELDHPIHHPAAVQQSARAASHLAALFDRNYADEDSENMEDDRLDLFHVGGATRKRKTQTKLTVSFSKTNKPKPSNDRAKFSGASHTHAAGTTQQSTSRIRRRIPPPALSVLDSDDFPSRSQRGMPDFLKVAKRQARQRPDFARQRPTNKYIRLHTARDTDDASKILRQWRQGALKPRSNASRSAKRSIDQDPLTPVDDNQQGSARPLEPWVMSHSDTTVRKQSASTQIPCLRARQRTPSGLLVFQHLLKAPSDGEIVPSGQPSRNRQSFYRKSISYQAAQLEGLETNFGSSDQRHAFAKGLQQVDRQYHLQSPAKASTNLQLSRFLVNDEAFFSPLPSGKDVGETVQESPVRNSQAPKNRVPRKVQAQRIDVDTREYRQPSEPAVNDFFLERLAKNSSIWSHQGSDQPVLQGLGPYGTRYPITFDASPLKSDTYFHASTFIGGGEFCQALPKPAEKARNFDEFAGSIVVGYDTNAIRCGPWDDETFAQISDLITAIWLPLDDRASREGEQSKAQENVWWGTSKVLRSIINYVATRLSFLDPIDRQSFATKMKQLAELLFEKMCATDTSIVEKTTTFAYQPRSQRPLTYLLVLTMQIRQIAYDSIVDRSLATGLTDVMQGISKLVVTHLLHNVPHLSDFLDKNKRFAERENGIQDSEIMVESLVICMQVLAHTAIPRASFWDLVAHELASRAEKATHLETFESLWGTLFTLLPYAEVDATGILDRNRRMPLNTDNWMLIKVLLKRLFVLYDQTYRMRRSSLNDYVRATLTRCHMLIQSWHWHRCDPALSEIFDFFAKNGLQLLKREKDGGSAQFLEDLAGQPSLSLDPNDNSFQIYLKSLALGLQGIHKLPQIYSEKKIRSIVLRLTPNHDRRCPKDQNLNTEKLEALKNHHDLLCTLYWASPPLCRPKLELIRGLVHHENSHREACKVNVRAWANLATFQLSSAEPYAAARPFAEWHRDMLQQTLKQYQLAKTEAADYLQSESLNDTDAASLMVRQTIERNQEQVIATLRDCIAGMQKAVETSMAKASVKEANQAAVRDFIAASGLVQLLELLHFKDMRLVVVIRDTLRVLRSYASLVKQMASRKISQQTSEESQDYGDSLDLDDIAQLEQQGHDRQSSQAPLAFIEDPLWRLLSNAFGAESAPDENLLMECIDTWALISGCQVSMGVRSWSYYLGPFSQVSWQQLRRTEQTQKFGPYLMAVLLSCDSTAYVGHEADFTSTLFSCLADRESMLRFQHCLLKAILAVDPTNPLLKNMPTILVDSTGELDITVETLRTRRLGLISKLLANMRDNFHAIVHDSPQQVTEVRSEYATMLKTFMTAMKSNYQQLGQGSTVAGTYVEFVQKVIQFLQQYTADICPILKFFTSSVTFPLPTMDPTYVVGRLCGYASKLSRAGVPKELSVFIQTVAQQAAGGAQQVYLVNQLKTALCTNEAPTRDRIALRDALLQGVFPAYIEAAFHSLAGLAIAMPLLRSLRSILQAMLFDIHVHDESSVRSAYDTIMAIAHAWIRSTEALKGNTPLFKQPHVLHSIGLMFDTMVPVVSLLEYIYGRYMDSSAKPNVVTYFEQLNVFIAKMLHGIVSHTVPSFAGDVHTSKCTHAALLPFSREALKDGIKINWTMSGSSVFFGRGRAQQEVKVDIESAEEEKVRLVDGTNRFYTAVASMYRNDYGHGNQNQMSLGGIDD